MQFFSTMIRSLSKMKLVIKPELTEELYRNYPISFLTTLLISSVLFWELLNVSERSILTKWYFIICSILLIRLILMYWYRQTKKNKKLFFFHYYLFIVGSTITAPLWGMMGSLLMPNDLPHQLFVLIIISGVLSGSVQSLSGSFFANLIYILLTLLPILIWELIQIQQGIKIYIGIFTLMALYTLFSPIIAYRNFLLLVNNIELRNILKNQTIHDLLTGLFNRLYLEEYLKLEIHRSKRNNYPIALMMIDLDKFKPYNDTYGHLMGDQILKKLGVFLKENMRSSDMACRYGGDEFLIILPNTSKNTARFRAEELRDSVKKIEFRDSNTVLKGITLSFGIAVYPEHGLKIEKIIKAADRALYEAKKAGGDRVCLAK